MKKAAIRVKTGSNIGAPAVFALEQACLQLNQAFGGFGCYVVGSSLERPDWRDVDVRFILADDEFAALFPRAGQHWEHDPRWLLMTVAISERLSKVRGLPIDFQFQPQTHANERHKGQRSAFGLNNCRDAIEHSITFEWRITALVLCNSLSVGSAVARTMR
jgi:hypothetical protein